MDRLTAIRVFIEVADCHSLTQAAERLDMSRAMASRYIGSLEEWLGARLLHRTTRRISLSDAGEEALPRCRHMLALSEEVQAVAGKRSQEPAGKLRITTSLSFAQAQLTAAVVEFQGRYPRVEIELFAVDRSVNLVEERIDLAVRITNALDDGFVARKLCLCRSVLCASPDYVKRHGSPAHTSDLASRNCITHAFGSGAEYRLRHKGQTAAVAVRGTLFSNETAVLRQAVLAGAGIALLPTYYVVEELQRGALVRLLPEYEPEPLGIHAVYLSRQHQSHALKLLIDMLAQRFGGESAPWDRPHQPGTRGVVRVGRGRI
ncbi:MAG TPA: LysR family transcriptional regulator [Burkholderiaceae bacterium]|nr:LysR family transcriptional regulator [Burkholderiaceae bacterium]